MESHGLTRMKKIEIVVSGDVLDAVKAILEAAPVSGYTIVPNVAGMGHHGYHEGRLLFNEIGSLVLVVTVVPDDLVDAIMPGILPLVERHSGVVFVSETAVSRTAYFGAR